MRLRRPAVVVMAAVCAFAGGLVSSRVFERSARAQQAPLASTIYVPSDGLAFRTFDGHVVARLSYDDHGGVLELYDEHERPASRFRGNPLSSHFTPAASSADCSPPYVVDALGRELFKPECL
jgi:hypothetical protein